MSLCLDGWNPDRIPERPDQVRPDWFRQVSPEPRVRGLHKAAKGRAVTTALPVSFEANALLKSFQLRSMEQDITITPIEVRQLLRLQGRTSSGITRFFTAPAALFGTVPHLSPVLFPFFSPRESPPTNETQLLLEIGFLSLFSHNPRIPGIFIRSAQNPLPWEKRDWFESPSMDSERCLCRSVSLRRFL